MAKKIKDDVPNPNSIQNRDILQRLNFLYQASSYLNGVGVATSPRRTDKTGEKAIGLGFAETNEACPHAGDTQKRSGKRRATVHDISRSYVKSMKLIGQKTNVRMDPTVKRTICKGCNMLLMPGVTAKVRVKPFPTHGHVVKYTCTTCSFTRRIPAPPTVERESGPGAVQTGSESTKSLQRMDVDPVDELLDSVKEEMNSRNICFGKQRKKRKHPKQRTVKLHPLPFFERPDHILFVGNERLDQNPEIKD